MVIEINPHLSRQCGGHACRLFLDHVVAPTRSANSWIARDTVAFIRAAGFWLDALDEHDQPAMHPLFRRLASGIAVRS